MGGKKISTFTKTKELFSKARETVIGSAVVLSVLAALAAPVIFATTLSGCSKKSSDQSLSAEGEDYGTVQEETFIKIESTSSTLESVMLGGSLWRENASGYMEWVRDVPAGTAIGAYRNPDKNDSYPAEIKRNALRTSDWSRRNFVHVLYNSADYWAQEIFIALDAKPGVVVGGGAFLYNSADAAGSGRWIGDGVELAVFNPRNDSAANTGETTAASSNLLEVSVYLRDFGLVPNKFMVAEKISTKADDITAMHILGKLGQRGGNGLLLIQDGVVRNELKDIAGRLDISDSVRAKIKNY
ncbi:MAG: hypothetical protein K6E22_10900 [Treponema sp.]|nr:hypothetical protein [Treponema sp.]